MNNLLIISAIAFFIFLYASQYNRGQKQSIDRQIYAYQTKAEQGDEQAQMALAELYFSGKNTLIS